MNDAEAIKLALTKSVERVVTGLSLEIRGNLVKASSEGGTPVDTGWASGNWVAAIGRDRLSVAGGQGGNGGRNAKGQFKSKGAKRTSGEIAGAQAAGALGDAQVLVYKLPQGAIFISNNVPYITLLNAGSSKKAPAGFVERGIDKALGMRFTR